MDRTEQLARQARSGDKEAFTALVLENEAVLSRVALSILGNPDDGADAVQEAVFEAWKNLKKLRQPQYFRTWLTRILIRKCYDLLGQRKKHSHASLEDSLDLPVTWGPDRDQTLDVRSALDSLEQSDRLLLGLYYHDGFPVKEIAGILNLSQQAVRQRLHRSRLKFRAAYLEIEVKNHEA